MNLATLQFHSPSLDRHVSYTAILPERQTGPAPVLLQLHGYTDDHTAWIRFSNLVRHAATYPFLIVMPDGGNSYYLNVNGLMRYEEFLMQDLVSHVSRTFQVRPGPWAIGGLSMGGYGALRLAARYPERFASVWSHSGAFWSPEEMRFLPEGGAAEADIYAAVASLAGRANAPVIGLDCGTEDFLLPQNRRMHAHLDRLGIAHRYTEHPGAHTWEYWDLHVQTALRAHAEVMT